MAHLVHDNPEDAVFDNDTNAPAANYVHSGPDFVSREEMLREIKEATERELKNLDKMYKQNYHFVDRTSHYKSHFFTFGGFRINKSKWILNLLQIIFPFRLLVTHCKNPMIVILVVMYCALIAQLGSSHAAHVFALFDRSTLQTLGVPYIFDFELWQSVVMYLGFGILYATQISTWTLSTSQTHQRAEKLSKLKLLHFTTSRNVPVTISADEVAQAVVARTYASRKWTLWVSYVAAFSLSFIYACLPFVFRRLARPSFARKDGQSGESPLEVNAMLSAAAAVSHWSLVLFRFLLMAILFAELGVSLYYIYARVQSLRLFAMLSSFNKSARRRLPYIQLNTPENVLGWQQIRAYLQSLSGARMAFFNVLMVFVVAFLGVYLGILGQRFWTAKALDLTDVNAFFIAGVVGAYFLAIIYMGALVDVTQRGHVKLLLKAKWKLEQARLVPVGNPASVEPKRLDYSSPPSAAKLTSPAKKNKGKTKMTDSPSRVAPRRAEEDSDDSDGEGGTADAFDLTPTTPQGRDGGYSSFIANSSPRSPLSPVSLMKPIEGDEEKVSSMTKRLLSKLIKLIQSTDQPLRVLYLKVDVGLAAKVFGILASVFIARIRALLAGKQQ